MSPPTGEGRAPRVSLALRRRCQGPGGRRGRGASQCSAGLAAQTHSARTSLGPRCRLAITWPLISFDPRCHLTNPRLATSEAPDAMEEWDVPQMKKEVESLKYQLAFKREMSSKTIPELLKWIEDGIPKDPFLNPDLMKNNPWVEKGKCAIL
ncbi:guanine nucleotide-binding protein G(I)/G(S)/G(O) subunit gamma-13 isoform X1 [Sciurus carolinensis]|uniref:guanine nucleotide-binding protein G(I)/G(S)/G(O) subunit gamma-13 isoform X1 n=1 Tax=Sciurus carolinensis TaxID=30640 RepID=UPI001FB454B2|nr:guanine nucleotide-binding protein G(I)/G(S)/G(O) subunit gamma-13 isoform X1 [Sciurus carolinensis]